MEQSFNFGPNDLTLNREPPETVLLFMSQLDSPQDPLALT